jgi:hypothetical protein
MITVEDKLIAALKKLKYASVQTMSECAQIEVWSAKRAIRSMRKKSMVYICRWVIEDGELVRVFMEGNEPDAKQPEAEEIARQREQYWKMNLRPDIAASWIKRKA